MGIFINKGNEGFKRALNGEYVDKTGMIEIINKTLDTTGFSNNMYDVRSKNDVFTVLIHLGYLAYDKKEKECFIPNKDVRMEMVNAVAGCHWHVAKALCKVS